MSINEDCACGNPCGLEPMGCIDCADVMIGKEVNDYDEYDEYFNADDVEYKSEDWNEI
jgi:hypothetical protein